MALHRRYRVATNISTVLIGRFLKTRLCRTAVPLGFASDATPTSRQRKRMDHQQPLGSSEAARALALVKKGQQLGGHQPTAADLDRARRILVGELSPEDARTEMHAALQALVEDERAN